MTRSRPPLPARWEYHLITTVLDAVLIAVEVHQRRTASTVAADDPEPGPWLHRRGSNPGPNPSWAQLQRERRAIRIVTGAWLARRAYQLEQQQHKDPAM